MDFSKVTALVIPEGVVGKIVSAGETLWQLAAEGIKNWIKYATETDKVTLYNGCGYKDGYRLNSSGSEVALSTAYHTGYIPAVRGDIIRVAGNVDSWTYGGQYIAFYEADMTLIASLSTSSLISSYGAYEENQGGNIYMLSFDTSKLAASGYTNLSYIRISGAGKGADMIVTINEEIA